MFLEGSRNFCVVLCGRLGASGRGRRDLAAACAYVMVGGAIILASPTLREELIGKLACSAGVGCTWHLVADVGDGSLRVGFGGRLRCDDFRKFIFGCLGGTFDAVPELGMVSRGLGFPPDFEQRLFPATDGKELFGRGCANCSGTRYVGVIRFVGSIGALRRPVDLRLPICGRNFRRRERGLDLDEITSDRECSIRVSLSSGVVISCSVVKLGSLSACSSLERGTCFSICRSTSEDRMLSAVDDGMLSATEDGMLSTAEDGVFSAAEVGAFFAVESVQTEISGSRDRVTLTVRMGGWTEYPPEFVIRCCFVPKRRDSKEQSREIRRTR